MKDTIEILRDIVTYVIGVTCEIEEDSETISFRIFQYNVPVSTLINVEQDLNTSEEFIFTYVKETKIHIKKEIKVFNDYFEVSHNSMERYTFYYKEEIDLKKFVLFLRPNYIGDIEEVIDWARSKKLINI